LNPLTAITRRENLATENILNSRVMQTQPSTGTYSLNATLGHDSPQTQNCMASVVTPRRERDPQEAAPVRECGFAKPNAGGSSSIIGSLEVN